MFYLYFIYIINPFNFIIKKDILQGNKDNSYFTTIKIFVCRIFNLTFENNSYTYYIKNFKIKFLKNKNSKILIKNV
jgi:hypothetical protein